jgi:hypothetical protein
MSATAEHAGTEEHYRTVLVLMKGPDADATIDALENSGQVIDVKDEGPYWKLQSHDDIHVDMAAVEAELGAPITLAKWLATMTSFVGYADRDKDDMRFSVHADRSGAVNHYPGG